ncbi:MAG: hypothetical protein FJ388_10895 [Verrucomicrobia bacterium]|nr:hypothetical protein [Verrucomicrobiota bacterium]
MKRHGLTELLREYLERSHQIIGDRTPEQIHYDDEVLRGMRRGLPVAKAIAEANQRFPSEALQVSEDQMADVEAHYRYLDEHEKIMAQMKQAS